MQKKSKKALTMYNKYDILYLPWKKGAYFFVLIFEGG